MTCMPKGDMSAAEVGKKVGNRTYVRDIALELRVEAVREPGEQRAATCKDDVAEEHLAEVGVAGTERGGDEPWDCLWEVGVRLLTSRLSN